ncbi:hypothetical protein HKD37_06G016418 [Glycine soja]
MKRRHCPKRPYTETQTLTFIYCNGKRSRSIKHRKSLSELPPSLTASSAAVFSCNARLTSAPFPLTDSARTRLNTSESGTVFSPSHTFFATFSSSTSNVASVYWSAVIGHASIGTPATTDSITEFHPQ